MDLRARTNMAAALTGLAVVSTACAPASSDNAASGQPATLVLADAQPLGEYNPVNGYSELGVSPLYDGLMRLQPLSDKEVPAIVPALAAAPPTSNPEQTVWDIDLRDGVTFHDGSPFDANDVVATYQAVLDPVSASEIAASYDMIDTVTEVDDRHVQFTLRYPYADFPARLLLGIAPSEKLVPGPARDSQLNQHPVGTGPYRLASLRPDQAVFEANPRYWGGAPKVSKLVTTYVPDDNSRAQQMQSGALSGTVIPPSLATSFTGGGMSVTAVQTADWRGVSLPSANAFTGDEQARIAMNLGVDRTALIDHVLAGHGRPAYTPFASVYGDAFNLDSVFTHNPEQAGRILDKAGWVTGPDGVRSRNGQRAEFLLLYPSSDTLRRDMSTAFAAAVQPLGIKVDLRGASWDDIGREATTAAVMLGGGDKPYSIDTQVYETLHTRGVNTPTYSNPGNFTIPGVDGALDLARRSLDPQVQKAAYKQVQEAYIEHPTHVFLAFVDHTYVTTDTSWDRGPLVLEPHTHGVTWGPWWNAAGWRP